MVTPHLTELTIKLSWIETNYATVRIVSDLAHNHALREGIQVDSRKSERFSQCGRNLKHLRQLFRTRYRVRGPRIIDGHVQHFPLGAVVHSLVARKPVRID